MTCVAVGQESELISITMWAFQRDCKNSPRKNDTTCLRFVTTLLLRFSISRYWVLLFVCFELIAKALWLSKFPRKLMILNELTCVSCFVLSFFIYFLFIGVISRRLKVAVSDAYKHIRHHHWINADCIRLVVS